MKLVFSNTDELNCPILSYSLLSASKGELSAEEATLVSFKYKTLEVKFTFKKAFSFYLVATMQTEEKVE